MKTEDIEGQFPQDQHLPQSNHLQIYFQSLKDCVQGQQSLQSFTALFYRFVRHSPQKQDIKFIGKQLRHRLIQWTKFKDVINSYVVITRLFKLWTLKRESTSDQSILFQQKIQIIKQNLHKNVLGEQLEQIFAFFKRQWQFRTHFEGLLDQKHIFQEEIQNLKQHRDKFRDIVYKVGLQLFQDLDIWQDIDNTLTSQKIIEKIASIKRSSPIQNNSIKPSHKDDNQLIRKLSIIKRKYELEGNTSIQILQSLDSNYQKLVKKNQQSSKHLQDKSINYDLSQLKTQNAQLKKQLLFYIKQQRQLKEKLKQQKTDAEAKHQHASIDKQPNLNQLYFSNSQIINQFDSNHTKFLLQGVQQLLKKKPKNSKILFTSRQNSSRNFHQFFDNIQNILLLVKLSNGSVIGGFSQEQFRPKCVGQKGFLFSLSKLEIYERTQKSTITYGDYYLIFGNSEISIKSNEMKLYSNFGTVNRHFNSKNRNTQFFLGEENSREVSIQLYEIYEIVLQ